MLRTNIVRLIALCALLAVGSCGPSEVEMNEEEIRGEHRAEAEEAVAEMRSREHERAREADVAAAYREWLVHMQRGSNPEHAKYEEAVKEVTFQGTTIVLEMPSARAEEALALCNLSLTDWTGRADHGVEDLRVVSVEDGTILAQSTLLPDWSRVCR